MKPKIHPDYQEAEVTCACGNTIKVGSTKAEIFTEACSACHPFFTGTKKIMDTAGRVERFAKLIEKTKTKKEAKIIAKGAPKKLRERKSTKTKKIG